MAELYRNLSGNLKPSLPAAATLGNFDGLHLGHKALVEKAKQLRDSLAGKSRLIVLSFYPHPDIVLGKAQAIPEITNLRQKLSVFSDWEVDALCLLHFTKKFSAVSADEFIARILIEKFGVRALALGPDASVGHKREGSAEYIVNSFSKRGLKAEIVPMVELDAGRRVSSGEIRRAIQAGELECAFRMLGRRYAVEGQVARGDRRGNSIGFPTANLKLGCQALPPIGVYCGYAEINSSRYRCVVNLGVRPTFGKSGVTFEAHLLDYSGGDFYGDRLQVELVSYLRSEAKFDGVSALRKQIEHDIAAARKILDNE